jgi:amidophosphoribosyltransferase
VRSRRFAPAQPKGCLFEYVYLARPDTTIAGRSVQATRVEVGRRLAAEHPVEADLVIPVPESGTPAAIGYAEASGIPYGRAWSRTPTSAGRSSSRARPSASSASGSS